MENDKMTELELENARDAFEAICEAMDNYNLVYDKDEDEMTVDLTISGQDMPIEMHFRVHPDKEIVRMISPMPYIVPREKRLDMAVALTFVNIRLINGCYDLDMKTGHIGFRLVESYAGSRLGYEAIQYLISITNITEDNYNDKLIMLNKDIITLRKFVSLVTANDEALRGDAPPPAPPLFDDFPEESPFEDEYADDDEELFLTDDEDTDDDDDDGGEDPFIGYPKDLPEDLS